MAENSEADKARPKRAKARSGCVRCRAKRRKCDEVKPVCGRCKDRREGCQWGTRIVFREENNHGLGTQQRSIKNKKPKKPHLSRFEIQDITAEVIRDHQQRDSTESASVIASPEITEEKEISRVTKMADSTLEDDVRAWEIAATLEMMSAPTENGPETDVDYQHNLDIGLNDEATGLPALDDLAYVWPSPSALGTYDDSIFLPGSAYLDAHFTLRSHLIQEVHTGNAIRVGAPESLRDDRFEAPGLSSADFRDVASQTSILAEGEEFQLLQNWVEEVAPWMDKFDSERHFQHTLPIMARSHSHLRFSILAASARQLERKERSTGTDRSLALYQQAIQLVLPELHTRSTAVIASCVVLCVLEMQSSSPKAWRQHLDGCAHLIQASGINGFSGGIDQALFWCFARMDVCGGLITSMSTLIPMKHWTPGTALAEHTTFFGNATGFNAHACYAVYICGKVLELFSHKSQLASRVGPSPTAGVSETSSVYASRWAKLWRNIDDWYHYRPDEMMPIHYVDAQTSPFPKILYSNPAAISGNQLHHTACILMLQHKPSSVVLARKPRSIFWHARQACAISISNHHHGAWTNSIQPLWIAGQWMSHPSEQKAILELLERIERETGWGTKGRAEDLKDFWGD